ncbi:MAG: phosphopantothenate/pantothenate synthetase [Candidatus Thermoplasmatota archaeon]|nr:phosphopantothenate/pantothenate synthetase [Candidatus Thermoplasmatota archaeon]
MGEFTADKSHPRYKSLLSRHKLEIAASNGLLADSALIAHGRGEAFDYLLGEKTSVNAMTATKNALAHLMAAKRPIITINGNTAALAGKELMEIAEALQCPVEINIFYRTEERVSALFEYLNQIKQEHNINTPVLGRNPDGKIPNLAGPRANCCVDGIISSDVILVPLEDGDRCEALVGMGKTVIVVDLNPLSRSAKMASITIVDEISRVANNMLDIIHSNCNLAIDIDFINSKNLRERLKIIASRYH